MTTCQAFLICFRYSTEAETIGDAYAHLDSIDINKQNIDPEQFEKEWVGVDLVRESYRWFESL